MAETKKASSKRIIDVQHADKAPAEDNSKPVIVTNRPILQDPMVVGAPADEAAPDPAAKPNTGGETVIQPLTAPEIPNGKNEPASKEPAKEVEPELEVEESAEPEQTEEPSPQLDKTKTLADLDAESKTKVNTKPDATADDSQDKSAKDPENTEDDDTPESQASAASKEIQAEEAEVVAQAKKDEELLKLTESKKYFLPINSIEKRRSKQVVAAGVLLSLILLVAWVDVALDAGLIDLGNIKSVTHFFST
jgi:hypothetical protein